MIKIYKYLIILLIIIILNMNSSFANSNIAKEDIVQFKIDMSQAITTVLQNVDKVNDIYNESMDIYSTCKNNTIKELKICSNKITQNAYKLSYIDLYNPLLQVIKNYNIDISDNENEYDYIYKKILKKYKIKNAKEYKLFVTDIDNKKSALLKISHNMIDNDIYNEENNYEYNKNSFLDNTHVTAAEMEEQNRINQKNDMNEEDIFVILICAMICVYFIPSLVAILKRHKNTCAVIVLNIFLGWTFFGWVIALVWACCNTKNN